MGRIVHEHGVASLVVFQVADSGGVAVLEVEDHSPVGADRDARNPMLGRT